MCGTSLAHASCSTKTGARRGVSFALPNGRKGKVIERIAFAGGGVLTRWCFLIALRGVPRPLDTGTNGMNKSIKSATIYSIVILSFFLSACPYPPFSCRSWIEKEIKPIEIAGIVIYKSVNKNCEADITIKQFNDSIDTLRFCTCLQYRETWDSISEGDTLIKEKDSTRLEIHNARMQFDFEYPCCDY